LGFTKAFDLNGSVWAPRSPTADVLETYSDSNGSAYRYYDADRQAYEFYDANGVLLRVQQLNGDTYTLYYSDGGTPSNIAPFPGLLIRIAANSGEQLHLTYNAYGLLSQLEDPADNITTYSYGGSDAPDGYLSAVTYSDDNVRQYKSPETGTTTNTFDAAGNLLTSTDARGAVTTYTYDALNRVTQVSAVLSRQHRYDHLQL
jgi:YD repeat-containing protein